jgi:hypothetical protein
MTNTPRSAEVAAAQAATGIATTHAGDATITVQPKEGQGGSNSGSSSSAGHVGGDVHETEQHSSPDLSAMLPKDDAMVYGGEQCTVLMRCVAERCNSSTSA